MSPEDRTNSNQGGHDHHAQESFRAALGRITSSESGISVVYSTLNLLAEWYALDDAVIIINVESFGTQVFRLGGKSFDGILAARLGSSPGVFCFPNVVPNSDLDETYVACKSALALHLTRFNAEHHLSDIPELPDLLLPSHSDSRPFSSARFTSPLASIRLASSRGRVSMSLVIADVFIFIMTIAGFHGPVRFVFGLILGLIIPGWAVVGFLKLNNAALELSLTLATSLSLVMVAAQIMITVHLWHPIAFEELACLLCLPSLVWQSLRIPRRA